MTDTTPRAGAPLLAANQAQKNVTHNEALYQFDALLCARFLDRDLSAPPSSPTDGDAYLVKATASGAWTGQDGKIAYCADGAWRFYAPFAGLVAYVMDESALVIFDGSAWVDYGTLIALENLPMVGVNTTPDSTNKLAVKSNAALFTDLPTGSGGSGDIRVTLSKQAAANTASFLFQDNFSGRAEIGLCGDDNFHFKVSPDGASWYDGLDICNSDGSVDFLLSETTLASAATTDLGSASSLRVQITGTAAITSFGAAANRLRFVRFAGALTLTHNATSLILLGGASRTTAAGDVGIYTSDSSGNWRERDYCRAGSDPGDMATKSGTETLSNKTLSSPALSGTTTLPGSSAISSSGYLGIGISPSYPLHAYGSVAGAYWPLVVKNASADPSATCGTLWYNDSKYAYLSWASSTAATPNRFLLASNAGDMLFAPGGVSAVYANVSGNVAIGNASVVSGAKLDVGGHVYPHADNSYNLGSASYRFGTVYAGTGAINTSDGREKEWRGPLSDAELAAGKAIFAEIGGFKFLSSIAEKGEAAARLHFGVRAQNVAAIFTANGLDPNQYGINCYDTWPATPEIPAVPAIAAVEAILDDNGQVVVPAHPAMPGIPAEPARRAGDRYGIRADELLYFLMAVVDHRLAALEAA